MTMTKSSGDTLHLVLPFPPSGNHRNGRNGNNYYPTAKYQHFMAEVKLSLLAQLGAANPTADRYDLDIIYYPPDNRIRDEDNFNKTLKDAITKSQALWFDDHQCSPVRSDFGPVADGGSVHIIARRCEWREWEGAKKKRAEKKAGAIS